MDDELTSEELEFLDLYMYGIAPAEASSSKASSSKAEVDPLAALNKDASASIDVTYRVVWTAGEPLATLIKDASAVKYRMMWTAGDLWRSSPKLSQAAESCPLLWKALPVGSIRITNSTADGGLSSKCRAQEATRSAPTPQPVPKGKIPCIAMLQRDKLGARCTCLYDTATDSFGTFSENDENWSRENGYEDYGYIDMSTKKWNQGSWVSVEDDNGNEFLFLSVEKDHGVPRVWRPNIVAKRVVGDGETKLTYEEALRLGVEALRLGVEDDGAI